MNVLSALHMTDIFLKQRPKKGKAIISPNASVIHISPVRTVQLGYAASKAGLCTLMQGLADALDPEDVQIVSFHPGSVKSEAVLKSKWANAPIAWNTDTLPANFAVWSSTSLARFLHGRFVWCNWDVEELKAKKEFAHPGFCRMGLQGPKAISADELWTQMQERGKKAEGED